MPTRRGEAVWKGTLLEGNGSVRTESGALEDKPYSFTSRFEQGSGTNPEELIGAAHAGCFSQAFALLLEKAGHKPESIETSADVTVEKVGEDFKITGIRLHTKAKVPGIDEDAFRQQAEAAKVGCPVSRALAATEVGLDAELVH